MKKGLLANSDNDSNNYPPGYEPHRAYQLAYMSAWSYANLETFTDKLSLLLTENGEFLEFSVVNEGMFVSAYAQVLLMNDTALVSFRGTEPTNIANWIVDAGTAKVSFRDIRAHDGFLQNWQQVWSSVVEALTKWKNGSSSETKIYITGHSLGGAMAVLSAIELQQQHSELWSTVQGIYTYGQPMVVDRADRDIAQERIGSKLYRHVYWNDLVPHLPPLSVGAYAHVGYELKSWGIPQRNSTDASKSTYEWRQDNQATPVVSVLAAAPFAVADFVLHNIQWLSFLKMPWSMYDHNPALYVRVFTMVDSTEA